VGGKSRKSGSVSRKLIEKIAGKISSGKSKSKGGPSGLMDKGGLSWIEDFPGDEERKRREAEGEG